MGVNYTLLIGKLNKATRDAVQNAAGLCLSRTHYEVEIEHYLMKLLDSSSGDFACIVKQFGLDKARLASELTRSLDKLKSGNARTPSLSPSLLKMMTEAWTLGSIDYGAGQIRTGFTILALATNEELARIVHEVSKEFQKIQADSLRKDFQKIVAMSSEEALTASAEQASA
jgi:type VI secretion system protein VasG